MMVRLSLPKSELTADYAWSCQLRWFLLSYRNDFQLTAVVVCLMGLVGLRPNEQGCWL